MTPLASAGRIPAQNRSRIPAGTGAGFTRAAMWGNVRRTIPTARLAAPAAARSRSGTAGSAAPGGSGPVV